MPANVQPVFVLVPVAKSVSVSSATTDSPLRAGTGVNFGTVLSAGSSGTRLDRITATATGQISATQVLLFLNDGSSNWFFAELALPATTASSTVAGAQATLVRTDGLPVASLPSGYSLKCAITVSTTSGVVIVTGWGGDY